MPTLENVSGVAVDVPQIDVRVPAGGVFTVDAEVAKSLESNPHFRVKKPVKADGGKN